MKALTPITLLISDEPLLMQEAADEVIKTAKSLGVEQRDIYDVGDKFGWDNLFAESASLSLFSEVKLTDIRLEKTPDKQAQDALAEICQSANMENLFLIRMPKLEKRQKSAAWFKKLSADAEVKELWPPKLHEFGSWIRQRASAKQLSLSSEAIQLLAEQTEGNLLAANQTLEKLQLLYPNQTIETEQLSSVMANHAKYSVFLCLDEALAGKGERAVKMLHQFQLEGVAPISVLVNLSREVELCNQVSIDMAQGLSASESLAKSFLWDSKKRAIAQAAQRLPLAIWQRLYQRCAYLDRLVKGRETGDIWQELESCLWLISGQRIWGVKKG